MPKWSPADADAVRYCARAMFEQAARPDVSRFIAGWLEEMATIFASRPEDPEER